MTVAEFLSQSRAAHLAYRQLEAKRKGTNRAVARQQMPDVGSLMWDAYTLRLQAHTLDPAQQDTAWSEDTTANKGVPSSQMLDFYANFLDLPAESVRKAATL